ncbi:Methionyl-tRNA synthetase [Candidatus Johnevansia muelleri]|uniref:Methionine--tRNA ligase n=1 Tax=Candidatus Johnevansia muelleri TaxID=1495769 RepID=A0A078KBF0_9GAMM|nr:Methionyl-tRNA synthetase [Candidatus Evansia muelleri]
MRKILVTSAFPYANGELHLGHLLEYVQTDIWVRFQRILGNICYYVCADDTHGAAIMLSAEKEGISIKELIYSIIKQHKNDFTTFGIVFDNYHSTNSYENRINSESIYNRLYERGHIFTREIKQMYDPIKKMFLADRFIKGNCPKCNSQNQYGDNCEVCSATYMPIDLINPISIITGAKPIIKKSKHYFLNINNFYNFIKIWINYAVQSQITNKINEWFKVGLENWDISRDAPYFGFDIPYTNGKYFYVWFDALICYLTSFKNLCDRKGIDFNYFWNKNSDTEIYHFIGKDIVYFHTLFWTAILKGTDLRTPTGINCHGFITINGQKMSKSRGTFIKANTYAKFLNPEYLRYYFAAKLNSRIDDFDINFEDFIKRVNSDLVGKIINIASRCAKFINKLGYNRLSCNIAEPELIAYFIDIGEPIAKYFEKIELSCAINLIIKLADKANAYISNKAPWDLYKKKGNEKEIIDICSLGLNLFRQLIIYISPIIPKLATKAKIFLNIKSIDWENRKFLLINHLIKKFQPIIKRIKSENLKNLMEYSIKKYVHKN